MFSRLLKFTVLTLTFWITPVYADYIIVANSNLGLEKMGASDVKNIYLKKVTTLSGKLVVVVGLREGPVREAFLDEILKKSESSINAYWSRMLFSGRANPPRLFSNSQEALMYIKNNKGAIGFVDKNTELPQGVTLIALD